METTIKGEKREITGHIGQKGHLYVYNKFGDNYAMYSSLEAYETLSELPEYVDKETAEKDNVGGRDAYLIDLMIMRFDEDRSPIEISFTVSATGEIIDDEKTRRIILKKVGLARKAKQTDFKKILSAIKTDRKKKKIAKIAELESQIETEINTTSQVFLKTSQTLPERKRKLSYLQSLEKLVLINFQTIKI